MRELALDKLKKQRILRKKSSIFGQQKQAQVKQDGSTIDLTKDEALVNKEFN